MIRNERVSGQPPQRTATGAGAEQPHAPQGHTGSSLGSARIPVPRPSTAAKSLKPQWFPGVPQVVNTASVARPQTLSPSGPPSLVPAPGPLVLASPKVTFQSSLLAKSCARFKGGSQVPSSRKPQVLRRQGPEQGLHGPLPTPPRG